MPYELKLFSIPFGGAIKSKVGISGWRTVGKYYSRAQSETNEFYYYNDSNDRCMSNNDAGWDFDNIQINSNWTKIGMYWQRILYGKVFEIKYSAGKKNFGIYLTGVSIQEDENLNELIRAFELAKELFK